MKNATGVIRQVRRSSRSVRVVLVLMLSAGTSTAGLQAQGPAGGVVRAGDARISGEGTPVTRIDQQSERAVIDWRSFGIGSGDQVIFTQPSAAAATLNRVTGDQVSVILGRLDANGQVLLVNPNGVVFGGGAQVNVGSLVATPSSIETGAFMAGRLVFDAPGRPGAGVWNAGAITARDGGLVALVAPHVRNDGVIVARLGRVALGAADTFTVDLYGDALINLALSDVHAGQLRHANGEPVTSLVTHSGQITSGDTVLITARGAKQVLDSLINATGTIRAERAVQQGGRILLLGEGGRVSVDGALTASGAAGSSIAVLGDTVRVGAAARLDASGTTAGGSVHVGGAWQGGGDTYRATTTTVEAGATLAANATSLGAGGEVVVWSDGHTAFAGHVEARGGAAGGDGGRLEVSGKQTLAFAGTADASAPTGAAGSLLLDPTDLTIGEAEAGVLARVLRTGTSTSLQADRDITVNAPIVGGDRVAGGGLSLTAGQHIAVNDFIVTNNGAISLTAQTGTVTVAPGKAVFSGTAPLTVVTQGTISTGALVSGGPLSVRSVAGSVRVDSVLDGRSGPIDLRAGEDVEISQAIVNLASGPQALTVAAGRDVTVAAPVDGRGGVEGGAITMTAGNRLTVAQPIVSNNAGVTLTASGGALTVAEGTPIVTGTGALALSARGDVTTGPASASTFAVMSAAGAVHVNGLIDAATGDARLSAATDVNINQAIVNGQTGRSLAVTAGRDVNVNAIVDGRGGVSGGAVTMTAGRNLNVNDWIATGNGAVGLTATGGAATVASGRGIVSGNGAITMRAAGDVTTGAVSGGSFEAASTGGAVRLNGLVDGSTGRVNLSAASDVVVNAAVLNGRSGAAFNATAGRDVIVNAAIDGRGGATGGAVALRAGRDVAINSTIATNNGAIGATATSGALDMARGTALVAGNQPITLAAGSSIRTRAISGGSLSANAGGGAVNIEGVIDGNTGPVELRAGGDVNINDVVLSPRSGSGFSASAGGSVNVNARIDGTSGVPGGGVTLSAARDVNVNAAITTQNGAITVAAANGIASVAPSAGLFAGTGAVSVNALGTVTTGPITSGGLAVTSRGGSVLVNGAVAGSGSPMTIGAAGAVTVANSIVNPGAASPLTVTAGTNIAVNAHVGRSAVGVPSGAISLTAGQNVTLTESLIAENNTISVTAQNGTVSVDGDEGLFAGNGAVTVQSGQSLSTPTVVTTGPVSLTSTAGSVNVDQAISGTTGPVTIAGALDVNVNQAIANPRTGSTLRITAGSTINVNAAVDGRDTVLPSPSGTTTLTAGQHVVLNADVVTRDSALSLTATNGSVTWGSGKGLFAGSGAINVTSGASLTTGPTTTTGALAFTSTAGDVNVNTAIADTVGAVTISAARDVDVNQTITNLKSGASLSVSAGRDILVDALVDGRSGAVPGGTVTMTANRNVALNTAVATSNGAVSLTATTGTITMPNGVAGNGEPTAAIIETGDAPISLTTGGNFSLASSVTTSGTLNIRSTGGNVTIAAPITNQTGAVTVTAANALTVNHQVKSNNQNIVLTAGTGGITVNSIVDNDQTLTAPVNSGTANLTLNSGGNVSVLDGRGVASTGTLRIDARGQIVTGSVGKSTSGGAQYPQNVVLIADQGIVSFSAPGPSNIDASSVGGSISLMVDSPSSLTVTTGTRGTTDCPTCNISILGALVGPDVDLNAGGNVTLGNTRGGALLLTARSGDANINDLVASDFLTVSAGRDANLNNRLWIGTNPAIGGLTVTAGRDIVTTVDSPIHISNDQPLTFTANRNIVLNLLETLGAVSLTATTGSITLNNDIGPQITNSTSAPDFNPLDKGVLSLTLAAGTNITMQGARAQGNVVVTAGGNLTAAKSITSVNGSVSLAVGGTVSINPVPIGSQEQMVFPPFVLPAVSPGPPMPLPSSPAGASASAAGLPAFGEIPVAAADQVLGSINQPGTANGGVLLSTSGGTVQPPARSSGSAPRPAPPSFPGGAAGATSAGTESAGTDSAAALRAAGQSCGENEGAADNGLASAVPAEGAQSDQQTASCGTAGAQAAAAGTPAPAPGGATPVAPPTPPVGNQQ